MSIRLAILKTVKKESKMLYTDLYHILCEPKTDKEPIMSNKTLCKYLQLLQKEERLSKNGHYYKLTKLGEKTLHISNIQKQLVELSIAELNTLHKELSGNFWLYNPEQDFPKVLAIEPLITIIMKQENLPENISIQDFFTYLKK